MALASSTSPIRDGELFPDASRDYHLILFLTVTMGIGVVAELPLMAV
jgi:hypothetical protein